MSSAQPGALICNVCGGRDSRLYHRQEDRFLMHCEACGLVFVDPLPSFEDKAEVERQAYEGDLLPEVAEFFRNCHRDFREDAVIRGFREGLVWIGRMRPPGRMLDVGPGTGIFLHLASKEFGWEPHGIDICPNSAAKAFEEFGIDVDVGEFESFPYEAESFDCVTMLDMLEHSLDTAAVLERAHTLLKPGGLLYVAVPNQHCLMTAILDRYVQWGGPRPKFFLDRLYVTPHLYYFNPKALGIAMGRAGFDVCDIRGGNVYLGRYRLPLWMRIPMEIVLQVGAVVGMSAKILALACKPER